MKQLKISLKLTMLLIVIFLMAVGCQKDDNINENSEPQNQYKKPPSFSANIFHGDSIINANAGLKNRLNQFNKTKASLRTMQSSQYNFSIDTTRVQKIQTSSYTSYTFTVVRPYPVEDVLENYVITHYSNDTYRQYFISYPHIDSNGEIAYDIDNAQISVLNDDSLVYYRDSPNCVSVIAYVDPVCVDIRCLSGEHTVDQGSLCRYWGTSNMATRECTEGGWVDQGCSGGDGGTSGGDTGGNNNGGNGPGDIEDTSDDEPEDEIFVPLSPTIAQEIENCINRPTLIGETDTTTIVPGLIASLNLGKSQLMDINNYLDQNQCSEQAQQMFLDILTILTANPNLSFEEAMEQLWVEIFGNAIFIQPPAFQTGIINDINSYFDCFTNNPNSTYKVTIFVDQPIAGSREPYVDADGNTKIFADKNTINVGHTFVQFSQSTNGLTNESKTAGLYPAQGVTPDNPNVPSAFYNDEGHHYDVALSVSVSSTQFFDMINDFKAIENYDLNNNNCTNQALDSFNAGGINLPSTEGSWFLGNGGGNNPGDLGEDIREMTLTPQMTRFTNGGTSPNNINSGC